MSRSGFAAVNWYSTRVDWVCSDSTLFESVLAELTNILPGCRVEKSVPKQTLVAPFKTTIDKLGVSGYYVAWWIMKHLCEKGWEPFDAREVFDTATSGHFSLRLVGRAD